MRATKKAATEARTLGQMVRALRESAGMTLRELAARTGVSAPFMSDLEHDRRRPRDIAALASALEVSEERLKALDGRLPPDLKEWVHENPEVVAFLRELKDSGRQVREVRLLFARNKPGSSPS